MSIRHAASKRKEFRDVVCDLKHTCNDVSPKTTTETPRKAKPTS